MRQRYHLGPNRILLITFFFGSLLSCAISSGQYMTSHVDACRAPCHTGEHPSIVACTDTCIGVPNGLNCTCVCNADNLSDGECYATCDYGYGDQTYCGGIEE